MKVVQKRTLVWQMSIYKYSLFRVQNWIPSVYVFANGQIEHP